jgi:hypothetical protein
MKMNNSVMNIVDKYFVDTAFDAQLEELVGSLTELLKERKSKPVEVQTLDYVNPSNSVTPLSGDKEALFKFMSKKTFIQKVTVTETSFLITEDDHDKDEITTEYEILCMLDNQPIDIVMQVLEDNRPVYIVIKIDGIVHYVRNNEEYEEYLPNSGLKSYDENAAAIFHRDYDIDGAYENPIQFLNDYLHVLTMNICVKMTDVYLTNELFEDLLDEVNIQRELEKMAKKNMKSRVKAAKSKK